MRNAITTPNNPVRGVGDFAGGGDSGVDLTAIDIDLTGDLTITQVQEASSFHNTVTVAPSGADFTSIQAAITSITDASATNPYVIKVAPGVYPETTNIEVSPGININGPQATVNATVRLHGENHVVLHKIETSGVYGLMKIVGGRSFVEVNRIASAVGIYIQNNNTLFCKVKLIEATRICVLITTTGFMYCDIGQLIVSGDTVPNNIAIQLRGSMVGRVGVMKGTVPGANNVGIRSGVEVGVGTIRQVLEVGSIETLTAYEVDNNRQLYLKVNKVTGTRIVEAGSAVFENGVQTVTPVDNYEVWADAGTYKIQGP